jgi:hypothetical protein
MIIQGRQCLSTTAVLAGRKEKYMKGKTEKLFFFRLEKYDRKKEKERRKKIIMRYYFYMSTITSPINAKSLPE